MRRRHRQQSHHRPKATGAAPVPGPPPPRMLRPVPVAPLNLTDRLMTTSPALRPLVIWVYPLALMPVVTACETWEPPTTLVTVA